MERYLWMPPDSCATSLTPFDFTYADAFSHLMPPVQSAARSPRQSAGDASAGARRHSHISTRLPFQSSA